MQTNIKYRVLFIVLIVAAGFTVTWLFVPLMPRGGEVAFTVSQGDPVKSIARALQRKRVVPWAPALTLWLHWTGTDKKIQAGDYVFRVNEGIVSAGRTLLHAKPVEHTLRIPEGLTIEQTAAAAARDLGVDTAAFIRLCYDPGFIAETGIAAVSLEGYLFPDTYRLGARDTTPKAVILTLTRRYHEVIKTLALPDSMQGAPGECGLVTLASIVEKEAALTDERKRIAAVFHNRLRVNMPLGADPTVRFVLRRFSGPLTVSDLNNPSPYNTRKYAGLPPGPICSPGLGSLEAAARPGQSDELYFVAKWDGGGGHDFSVTLQEHTRKKLRIRARNRQRLDSLNNEG